MTLFKHGVCSLCSARWVYEERGRATDSGSRCGCKLIQNLHLPSYLGWQNNIIYYFGVPRPNTHLISVPLSSPRFCIKFATTVPGRGTCLVQAADRPNGNKQFKRQLMFKVNDWHIQNRLEKQFRGTVQTTRETTQYTIIKHLNQELSERNE